MFRKEYRNIWKINPPITSNIMENFLYINTVMPKNKTSNTIIGAIYAID